jgi:streptomycin 6-kinase
VAHLSDDVVRTLLRRRGPEAQEWLEQLPNVLDAYAARWALTLGNPFTTLSFNYVTHATRADGVPAVLKIGVREDKEFWTEAEALRLYDGHGMVRLLDADLNDAVMLLESIEPGVPLAVIEDDEQAIAAAVRVMRQFWRPIAEPHVFPTVARWALGLERHRKRYGGSGLIPPRLFEQAEALYRDLGASMAGPALLHGDLHHDNILSATREPWLGIDPKGLVGEPAYETGALLRNPHEQLLALPDVRPLLARRIAQLSDELGIARARIHGWGIAQAVLSACWALEDGQDNGWAAFFIGCAQALDDITV